ncbi:transposase [Lysobacter sp. CAU 1642]|uniref:Transposase n=1 Tax=Pseudomarimonas salicorniae TaxID=2933270 RepID=A0ABT0GM64_9GAMM|nr:transposase [Lysobacter sp. CAU 1642]
MYLLTTCCAGGWKRFAEHPAAHEAARTLAQPCAWGDAGLLAWVLMPDHLHLLIQLEEQPLGRVMQQGKSRIAVAVQRIEQAPPPFWQPAFHDRALRSEEDIRRAARYLVANPLRAGLVDEIGAYPYWDAVWL